MSEACAAAVFSTSARSAAMLARTASASAFLPRRSPKIRIQVSRSSRVPYFRSSTFRPALRSGATMSSPLSPHWITTSGFRLEMCSTFGTKSLPATTGVSRNSGNIVPSIPFAAMEIATWLTPTLRAVDWSEPMIIDGTGMIADAIRPTGVSKVTVFPYWSTTVDTKKPARSVRAGSVSWMPSGAVSRSRTGGSAAPGCARGGCACARGRPARPGRAGPRGSVRARSSAGPARRSSTAGRCRRSATVW